MTTRSPKNKFRVLILISGRGSNFKAIHDKQLELEKIADSPFQIVGVISDRELALGLTLANNRGIPNKVVKKHCKEESNEIYGKRLSDACAEFAPDLIVLAGFLRILSTDLVMRFAGQIINIHPSLLPEFKGIYGADAQAEVIKAGVKVAGCTVHYVTEEIDGGPIISQASVPVLADDTPQTLAERILAEEHRIYPAAVIAIARRGLQLAN